MYLPGKPKSSQKLLAETPHGLRLPASSTGTATTACVCVPAVLETGSAQEAREASADSVSNPGPPPPVFDTVPGMAVDGEGASVQSGYC